MGKKEKVLHRVYLLLGSNLGSRAENLENAVSFLNRYAGNIVSRSSLYKSEPWGKQDQPEFLNQVLELETPLLPLDLLKVTQNCEENAGRIRKEKWGERILDIDILYYEREIIVKPYLKIPHPEIRNRKFTLVPLTELAPDYIHPVLNISNIQLLEKCSDSLSVTRI